MRHCNRAGRPPRDELIRHLRDAGEDPADLPPHELTRATCELEARHEGPHADHLGEIGRAEQLWVRWDGDRYTFVRLGPCEVSRP